MPSSQQVASVLSPERIVAELLDYDSLPEDAMRAAVADWPAVRPLFLEMLEDYVRDPAGNEDAGEGLFLIVHLFGQMAEKDAYRPLLRLCRLSEGQLDPLLGDAVAETLPCIIIGVFDGDPAPLLEAILDRDADTFARSSLMEALAYLAKQGLTDRGSVVAFLRECDSRLDPRDESNVVWVAWQDAIAYLGESDLAPLVRQAFADQRIDPSYLELKDFEGNLRQAAAPAPGESARLWSELRPFGDAIETLSGWYGFSEDYLQNRHRLAEEDRPEPSEDVDSTDPAAWLPIPPYVNPLRHVGRNDPCPCGSGRKFKKCCLGKAA